MTIAIVFAITATSAFDQTNGNLSGTVTDLTDAVLAGTNVKIVSVKNGAERTVTANADGFLHCPTASARQLYCDGNAAGFQIRASFIR